MNEPILRFTASAITHINKALTRYPQGGFRLAVKKAGCSGYKYMPEILAAAKPGDVEFTTPEGLKVFVDPDCITFVNGTLVNFVGKGLGQQQLVFENPNVMNACGCGESFHVKEGQHE